MNYYVEMIKDFVMSEIKKSDGKFLDDGEYVYACAIAFQKMMSCEKKKIVEKKSQILSEISTFRLLRVEMNSLIREYDKDIKQFNSEDKNLIRMVQEYEPKGDALDQVMLDLIKEGLLEKQTNRKYERQERYQKKAGLVSKTYKLNGQIVEEFAQACKTRGTSLGPTLTELMIQFIDETKNDAMKEE